MSMADGCCCSTLPIDSDADIVDDEDFFSLSGHICALDEETDDGDDDDDDEDVEDDGDEHADDNGDDIGDVLQFTPTKYALLLLLTS